ncbi:unnamed protein product [Bemisia tabaci]|uniref:phosphatidylinositol-3,4-bisphosphate 4-phosphatase n=1 Tax=Bemisia tabaci TaxID=7038 RepID=A0A9P0AGG1_BEMTA|nr:unnamed protein product [Bemisia tabaci]
MRYNKQELLTLATQPSQKFDKEGVLLVRERQDGFFRKTERKDSFKKGKRSKSLHELNCYGGSNKVSFERWCRLRGNLLFYFKTRDQWSEPVGVIVLEHCTIKVNQAPPIDGPFGFHIVFEGGQSHYLAAYSEQERALWLEAIQLAGYETTRSHLIALQQQLELKKGHDPNLSVNMVRLRKGQSLDPSEVPLCEIALACDNLLCDGHGRSPNPVLVARVFIPAEAVWLKYANTEVVQQSSNPSFLSTITFRSSDGLNEETQVRITAYDVREFASLTSVPIGSACFRLADILEMSEHRLRIPLQNSTSSTVGFLTLLIYRLDRNISKNPSTESTPCKSLPQKNSGSLIYCHRRSQSLPPRLGSKLKLPKQGRLKEVFANVTMSTYRFHSGLGGDISVQEVMAESRFCFTFPQQLLGVWMAEEKELLQEVAGMGELVEPWHSRQVELLDRHLQLLHLYSQAKENLQAHKGSFFKPSSRKFDRSLEFAPINLHLQRLCAQNETLKKSNMYDIISVGAFTAHAHKSKNGGLVKLIQQLKDLSVRSSSSCTNKISMANDAIQAIKQLRREVVDAMRLLMKLAKEKKTTGMLPICEDMVSKTRILLSLWDPYLVEEALSFIEEYKVTTIEERLEGEDSLSSMSPFHRITHQLNLNLRSGEIDDLATPDTPAMLKDVWNLASIHSLSKNGNNESANNSGSADGEQQFVIFPDAEEETQIPDENSNLSTSSNNNNSYNNGVSEEKKPNGMDNEVCRKFLDTHAMCNSPSANYYKPTDEPEPFDLTQLNIEASVMCLVSKVKFLCGRCSSPAVRLRTPKNIGKTQSFRNKLSEQELSPAKNERENEISCDALIEKDNDPKEIKDASNKRNKFTEGLDFASITDWATELRPSMRKLRQAMDGLLKTARLTHSVFRVQEDKRIAQRTCNVRYRRHVCFSQALTSVVVALVAKLWCEKADATFLHILLSVGPLLLFEGLLSVYADELDMWGDMIVAIEDLRSVRFTLVHHVKGEPILPRVVGSRASLGVHIPVPDSVYSLLFCVFSYRPSFYVVPIYFNVGINEVATIAETFGPSRPQQRNNLDNFERLNDYVRQFRKLNLFEAAAGGSKRGFFNLQQSPSKMDLLKQLKAAIESNKSKNVAILDLAAQITRGLKGLKFTSCKSGKDRTGMSVTLEQCNILRREYDLADSEFQRALDCMRSEGCRRENAYKNTGVRKFAFNSLQRMALPPLYKPPVGTFGSVQS